MIEAFEIRWVQPTDPQLKKLLFDELTCRFAKDKYVDNIHTFDVCRRDVHRPEAAEWLEFYPMNCNTLMRKRYQYPNYFLGAFGSFLRTVDDETDQMPLLEQMIEFFQSRGIPIIFETEDWTGMWYSPGSSRDDEDQLTEMSAPELTEQIIKRGN